MYRTYRKETARTLFHHNHWKREAPGLQPNKTFVSFTKSESLSQIELKPKEWYTKHDITIQTGEAVVHIDTKRQLLMTEARRKIPYDKLVIATGSSPHFLPIQGVSKKGSMLFVRLTIMRPFTLILYAMSVQQSLEVVYLVWKWPLVYRSLD